MRCVDRVGGLERVERGVRRHLVEEPAKSPAAVARQRLEVALDARPAVLEHRHRRRLAKHAATRADVRELVGSDLAKDDCERTALAPDGAQKRVDRDTAIGGARPARERDSGAEGQRETAVHDTDARCGARIGAAAPADADVAQAEQRGHVAAVAHEREFEVLRRGPRHCLQRGAIPGRDQPVLVHEAAPLLRHRVRQRIDDLDRRGHVAPLARFSSSCARSGRRPLCATSSIAALTRASPKVARILRSGGPQCVPKSAR